MARHTKTKLAALTFTFVAALGVVAAGPITAADAGHAPAKSTFKVAACC
jgi:hypothetical protein